MLKDYLLLSAKVRKALRCSFFLIGFISIIPINSFSQDCSCAEDFDFLVKKVEACYIGYYIKVTDVNRKQYEQFKESQRKKALKASVEECAIVLKDWVKYFRDYHLFLTEAPQFTEGELRDLAAKTESSNLTESQIKSYLEKNIYGLDSIEGLWYSAQGRFAIIKDIKKQRFIAVVLTPPSKNWMTGQLIAEFKKVLGGKYETLYFADDHSKRNLEASIHKNVLLNIIGAGGGWGKEFPLKEDEKNLLDPIDPQSPLFKIIDSNSVLLSLPSFGGAGYGEKLEKILKENKEQILASRNLLIDIRGNGGGSRIDLLLEPFILTGRIKENEANLVLASKDNIGVFKFLKKQRANKDSDSLTPVIARMEANPGKIVSYLEESYRTPEVIYDSPRNVAILIDNAVGSAAEAFILDAGQSRRVTLFGENTKGNIDYQQTFAFPLKCKKRGLFLSYPFYTRTRNLPKGGVDYKGIPPNVRIRRNVKNPIQFIVNYYDRKGK